jgi:hypothetical protein
VGRSFEDEWLETGFGEFKCGGEPCWAGSDHEVGCLVRKRMQILERKTWYEVMRSSNNVNATKE